MVTRAEAATRLWFFVYKTQADLLNGASLPLAAFTTSLGAERWVMGQSISPYIGTPCRQCDRIIPVNSEHVILQIDSISGPYPYHFCDSSCLVSWEAPKQQEGYPPDDPPPSEAIGPAPGP